MKTTKGVWIYTLLFLGVLLNSCMTTDDPGIADISQAKQEEMNRLRENSASRNGKKIKDRDGNEYSIVQIGTQLWMAENLKTTKYNDGTDITTGAWDWENMPTSGVYFWPNDDQATYGDTYGALYNWHAVNSGMLCPKGWHVPTQYEWATLIHYLDEEVLDYSIFSKVAGDKMRESGTLHWPSPSDATNESGFTALPAGYYWGTNVAFGNLGGWWSSTDITPDLPTHAWYVFIQGGNNTGYDYETVMAGQDKSAGESCRCIFD